jgi:hypothetical protein
MPWRIKTYDWSIPPEAVYSTKSYKNQDDAMKDAIELQKQGRRVSIEKVKK